MSDHPIKALKEMKDEPWAGRRNTRLVIVICAALCALAMVVFALLHAATLTAPVRPDPIAAGATRAFDVAP